MRRARPPLRSAPDEEWIELPADPRLLVSTHGRLYSTIRLQIVEPQMVGGHKGARSARLHWRLPTAGGEPRRWVVCARQMLEAFGPPAPDEDHVAICRDGDPSNVRLDNLEWRPSRPSQAAIDRIIAMRADGAVFRVIAEKLNAEGVSPPIAAEWTGYNARNVWTREMGRRDRALAAEWSRARRR